MTPNHTRHLLLNVGLAVNPENARALGRERLRVLDVVGALTAMNAEILRLEVRQSNTEPTAVVEIRTDASDSILEVLSAVLWQEAVAFWDIGSERGFLLGPKASAWGPFNPEFFLTFSRSATDNAVEHDLRAQLDDAHQTVAQLKQQVRELLTQSEFLRAENDHLNRITS